MEKNKGKLYMKLGGFKKISGHSPSKARSMGILPKIGLMHKSGRVILGLILIIIAAVWVNDNILKRGVESKCWFSMTGDTATVRGVITSIEFISLGVKNQHDYRILYNYSVNGKMYRGVSFQTGLSYRKNEAIDVTYSVKEPSCSCGCGTCPAEDAMFTIIFGGVLLLMAVFLVRSGMRRIFNAISIIEYGDRASATVRKISRSTRMTWSYRTVMSVTKWVAACEFKDSSGRTVSLEVITPEEDYIKKGDSITVIYDPGMPENALAVDALPFFVKTEPDMRA